MITHDRAKNFTILITKFKANIQPTENNTINYYYTSNFDLLGYLFMDDFNDIKNNTGESKDKEKMFTVNKYNMQSRIVKYLKEFKQVRIHELPNILK